MHRKGPWPQREVSPAQQVALRGPSPAETLDSNLSRPPRLGGGHALKGPLPSDAVLSWGLGRMSVLMERSELVLAFLPSGAFGGETFHPPSFLGF